MRGQLPKPKARSHPKEVLSSVWTLNWSPQPEEGVVLHGALPQVLARFLVTQTKDEGVFPLLPLVIVLHHHQCQLLLLKVQFGNFGPEE